MIRLLLVTTALLLAGASSALAQALDIPDCEAVRKRIDAIVSGDTSLSPRPIEDLVDIGQAPRCFAIMAGLETSLRDIVRRIEASRIDKQLAGSGGAAAATSVVSRGPAAKALSIAAEYGALTQSASGQIITLRANLAGLPTALVKRDILPYCSAVASSNRACIGGGVLDFLRRFSVSASFDPSRDETQIQATPEGQADAEGAQPATFDVNKRELTAFSARVDLWNKRDARSADFVGAWKIQVAKGVGPAARQLLAAGEVVADVVNLPEYSEWRAKTTARLRAAGRNEAAIVATWRRALLELIDIAREEVPDFDQRLGELVAAYSGFFLAQDELIASIANKTVVAFEYTQNRPTGQPSTSNYRVILDWPVSARAKIVGNLSTTYYDSKPAGVPGTDGRRRDTQVAAQLDYSLGDSTLLGPAVVTLAAYYQFQHAPALLEVDPAQPVPNVTFVGLPDGVKTVFAEKGDLWLLQAKLALTPPDSAVKIPLSVTYSNRTELIKADKPFWRGQLGIAYDLDPLFSRLGLR